jgi:crotonobetainyl-CoA:carnitine CoA-transferase CaiB-like acyl-CoA transferase
MAHLPLKGVRVIDFCVVWAGPFCTVLLGDLGAEVIKVENPFVMQPMTRGTRARVPKETLPHVAASVGGYPNNDPGPRPWNYPPSFVQLFRNKKSVTVDWRRPEGLDIIERLVAKSDVLVENNATETMEKLGLTYERLRAIKPDIIMVRLPAFGSTGPYANARATGVQLESVAGHSLLRGYADGDPSTNSAIYSGDYIAGAQAALATMMALWHRRKTGRGQLVEVPQAETATALLFQAFMDYSFNRNVQERLGNRSVYGAAPSGVYPCRSPGTPEDAGDRWIAITVASDDEWRALREVMGDPEWAQSADFETPEGRLAHHDLIDEKLSAWTRDFDDYELFHRLQAAGIAAAPVLEASRVMDDPHVQARGLYQPQRLFDDVGTFRFSAPFYRLPETPATVHQPPVAMGEHNEYVYKQVIGVTDDEYARLEAAGHISMDFDSSVP